jgi:hypothetical protein
MCALCLLVTAEIDGGVFITSQPVCLRGLEKAKAHKVSITRLDLPPTQDEIQLTPWVYSDHEKPS